MKLSIIIPSRNEEKYIHGVLGSIYESIIPFDFEVIVADNSTDSTRKPCSETTRKLNCCLKNMCVFVDAQLEKCCLQSLEAYKNLYSKF